MVRLLLDFAVVIIGNIQYLISIHTVDLFDSPQCCLTLAINFVYKAQFDGADFCEKMKNKQFSINAAVL